MTRLFIALAATLGAVSLSLGCSSQSSLKNGLVDGGAGGTGPSAGGSNSNGGSGGDGGGAAGDGPGSCDETASPSEAECLLTEDYGVFVSPTGSDDADGSRGTPVQTIAKAQALARDGAKSRIYLCHGTYAEAVTIASDTAEASLYGGFDCETWAHDDVKSVVSPASGSALRVDAVGLRVELQDLELTSADAEGGASSVAVFVSGSLEVAFDRVEIHAGKGSTPPLPDAPPTNHLAANLLGRPLPGATQPLLCECPIFGASTGSGGGSQGSVNGSKGSADPVASVDPLYSKADGGGGLGGNCTSGHAGARGAARPGGVAATAFGSITLDGWVPSIGGNGDPGNPGQGGGGGGLEDHGASTQNGGGGGCGSCGGNGGLGGTAGGSSIGLLVSDTTVILDASVIVTSDAAKGGTGGDGEDARIGGDGGSPAAGGPNFCEGGPGGTGAPGSGGAGGSGGISVGILYIDSPSPSIDGMPQADAESLPSFTLGEAGRGGDGGVGGTIMSTANVPANFGENGETGMAGLSSAVLGL